MSLLESVEYRQIKAINNNYISAFQSIYGLTFACGKSASEIREDTVVSDAILCPAVCVCDVMNKAGMCGSGVYYVMSQPCSGKERIQHTITTEVPHEEFKMEGGGGGERERD